MRQQVRQRSSSRLWYREWGESAGTWTGGRRSGVVSLEGQEKLGGPDAWGGVTVGVYLGGGVDDIGL